MVRERTSTRIFHDVLIVPPAEVVPGFNVTSRFPVSAPLEVDVGCGRGRFLIAHAGSHPNTNFLGIDRATVRLRKIDRRASQTGLTNIQLIQGDAIRVVEEILFPLSVSVFYVFYPDPWPKRRHHCRRLVSATFIDRIHATLLENGIIHLCTDHEHYFLAIHALFALDPRFVEITPFVPSPEEETDFGMLFRTLARTARRCSFRKQSSPVARAQTAPPPPETAISGIHHA
jgi:tRNA (guanine-N7-)-methyltransferase